MVNYFWKEGVPIRGLQCVCYCPDHFRDKSVISDGGREVAIPLS